MNKQEFLTMLAAAAKDPRINNPHLEGGRIRLGPVGSYPRCPITAVAQYLEVGTFSNGSYGRAAAAICLDMGAYITPDDIATAADVTFPCRPHVAALRAELLTACGLPTTEGESNAQSQV